jgi:hypothetical protein
MILVAPVLALAEEAKPPSAHFHGSVGAPLPNVKLPQAIPADDGKLAIYADFGKAKDGKVPLYLVNRAAEPKVFSSQDLDIFLKLERRMSDGRWERVQVHQDSWCGNSHYPVELPPGNHFAFSGYLPTAGSKAQVRFRSYGSSPLVSNEGEGFFLEEDRLAAGLDQMALRELPDSLQTYFRFDPDKPQGTGNPISDETFVSALRLLSSYCESPYARTKAEAFLRAKKETDSNSPEVVQSIRDILGREWPATAEAGSLLKAAFEELPNHPIPAWSVLDELLRKGVAPIQGDEAQFGRSVAEELEKALHRNQAGEIAEVARLIGSPRFAGEHFNDAFLEKCPVHRTRFWFESAPMASVSGGGLTRWPRLDLNSNQTLKSSFYVLWLALAYPNPGRKVHVTRTPKLNADFGLIVRPGNRFSPCLPFTISVLAATPTGSTLPYMSH